MVSGVTLNVIKMGVAVEAAALTVVGFTTKIASGLDKLYWQSQRTGATANNIRAIGYAFSQAGGSVEGFNGTLDNVARFLRSTPGAEGFLRNLGIQTRDANGKLRDTAQLVTLVGDKLAKMPYYRANQYAQILGIDENTLLAMRRGVQGFTSDYQGMLQATGFDSQKAAEQSNKFMTQMRGLTSLFGIMRDKIGGNLAGGLAGNLESFRKNILLNFPKIEGTITAVLKKVLSLADSIMRLVYRGIQGVGDLMKWWGKLDDSTKNLIKLFGGLLVAWRILNSAFVKSPIGMISALVATLILLYDDYRTWKEGGDSLIDWAKWQPSIDKAIVAIKDIVSWFDKGAAAIGGWQTALEIFAGFMAVTWAARMIKAIGSVTSSVGGLSGALKGLGKVGTIGALLAIEEHIAKPLEEKYSWLKNNPVANFLNKLPGSDTVDEWGKKILPWRRDEPEQHAQSASAPRGIRNNNPGNLNYVGQNGAALENHATPRFARFNSAFEGFSALGKQIKAYYNGTSKAAGYQKLQSVEAIISRFAPASENNTQGYIDKLSKMLGVGRGDSLNIHDPQVLATLMNGITQIENGKNPYAPEMVLKAAQSTVGASGGANNPVFNINVQGGGDPRETARLTGNAVEGVYRRQTRNLQTQVG
ncbi:lytic transglycosylase domain-containing protein [Serratia proteamaculans]|uniref:Lytic transglycosylase domain-containing protein n=1 Tax=Serratia proteamaculans TaxID=28151 RepID=A0ABS0TWD1_SERPR|nr:lytic transglycosylase domain-containing protein [Serratia proteamaculans]